MLMPPMSKPLSYSRAILQMNKAGTRLCQMHEKGELAWFLVPGGPISADTARMIIAQRNVIGQKDAMFPGLHQTWIVRKAADRSQAQNPSN
jgi:hypothetical protein